MVSVLDIKPQGSRVQTWPRRWLFRGDKSPQHAFLRKGSKAGGPCRNILRHVKITCKYEQKYSARPNSLIPLPVLPPCYQMTTGRIYRELWWTNEEFSSVDIIPPWLSWGMNYRPIVSAVQRRSLIHQHNHHLLRLLWCCVLLTRRNCCLHNQGNPW
jgi:hypothetical protein